MYETFHAFVARYKADCIDQIFLSLICSIFETKNTDKNISTQQAHKTF